MENRHEKYEGEIKENLEKVINIYFQEFLNKFDHFNNQMKIAELLLKAYQYRYDKMKLKLSNINDVISENYEEQIENLKKYEKLDSIEAKLTQVEVKLHLLVQRIDSIADKMNINDEKNNLNNV